MKPLADLQTRWRASPVILVSLVLHAALLAAWLALPSAWPWWLGILVANHAVLTFAGLWPRSTLLGPNLTQLPMSAQARGEIAITIDDGPEPDITPAVLDILDAHQARATFFCIGAKASHHAELCREIVRRGHSVQNHSQHHRHHFSLFGMTRLRREIDAAQQTLAGITGIVPTLFRAPAGLRNPFLDPVLHALRLRLTRWTRRGFDTRERDPQRVLQRLIDGLAAGDILLLHDGHAARTQAGVPVILVVLPELLAACRRAGLLPRSLPAALE
ncbi:polysaccharide deacetylase family protein [soil metagenome]